MKLLIVTLVLFTSTLTQAQTHSDLLGGWKLTQFLIGSTPFCKGAYGKLIYEKTGYVSVAINCPGIVTTQDPAFDYHGSLFYSGRFHLQGSAIIHRISNSNVPNLIGKNVARTIESLSTHALVLTGNLGDKSLRIEWKR